MPDSEHPKVGMFQEDGDPQSAREEREAHEDGVGGMGEGKQCGGQGNGRPRREKHPQIPGQEGVQEELLKEAPDRIQGQDEPEG